MITVKVDTKEYSFETKWQEFTYSRFCEVVGASDSSLIERLSKYTTIPIINLNGLDFAQISYLTGLCAFMDNHEDAILFCKPYSDDLSIAKETYQKIEMAKTYLQSKKPILALSEIVELYYGENLKDTLIVDSLGKGLALLQKIDEFTKSYPELYEYQPTPEEVEAGVEDLSVLGSFYTVKKMAEKFQKHPDEILNWEAGVVYAFLKADAIDARINRNLQKIYSRKK